MEILNNLVGQLKDLSKPIQAFLIFAVLCGVVAFGYFEFNKVEDPTVQKTVGDINNSGTATNGNADAKQEINF